MCITVFVLPALYYSFLPSLFFNGNNKNYCNESRQNLKPFDVKYKSYRNLKIALEEGFVAGIDEFYSEKISYPVWGTKKSFNNFKKDRSIPLEVYFMNIFIRFRILIMFLSLQRFRIHIYLTYYYRNVSFLFSFSFSTRIS